MLPTLAQLYGISVDELIGLKGSTTKRGPAPKLQRQVEQISRMPRTKQRLAMNMLEAIIQQQA
jgi:hypothetical protein